jgi:hypothetical protein
LLLHRGNADWFDPLLESYSVDERPDLILFIVALVGSLEWELVAYPLVDVDLNLPELAQDREIFSCS